MAIIDGTNGIGRAIDCKNIKEEKGMKELHRGIDIGSESHHVIIMDDDSKVLLDRKISHKFSEFDEAIVEFKGIEERQQGKITLRLFNFHILLIP